MKEQNSNIEDDQETPANEKKAYQSPQCVRHSPLEHVRAWVDRSSELVF